MFTVGVLNSNFKKREKNNSLLLSTLMPFIFNKKAFKPKPDHSVGGVLGNYLAGAVVFASSFTHSPFMKTHRKWNV